MQTFIYPAHFERTDGEIVVRFPDFPEALTGAATEAEARLLAADALEEAVLGYLAEGRSVPAPRAIAAGEEPVTLDPVTAGRARVQQLMAAGRMSKVALAAAMHKDEKVVRRILDGSGAVSFATVIDALRALGVRPALSA